MTRGDLLVSFGSLISKTEYFILKKFFDVFSFPQVFPLVRWDRSPQ